jgi:GLPGLI family protein
MKIFILAISSILSIAIQAQPKIIDRAIISTSTNVIPPDDDEDVTQIQQQGGGGSFNFRNMMDGETKSTVYYTTDLVRTDMKSETYKGSTYRDNVKKMTTTIFEMMGNRQGFYSSDDDQVEMKKRTDSMIAERMKVDTTMKMRPRTIDPEVNIVYLEDSKKIAGYNCKKALIIVDRIIRKDTSEVWYTPEIKFANLSSTGGTSGFGMMSNMMSNGVNYDKINGFVMAYERKMPRGRKMEVKVTKIDTDKEIAVKEFEIPKDIEIKNAKDMMRGGSGNVRMFMGGGR